MADAFDPDVEWHPIASQARVIWACLVAIPTAVLGAALVVVAIVEGAAGAAVAVGALTVAIAGVELWAVGRRWRAWGYAERGTDLLLRKGVLIRTLTIVPYGRMQFVDVRQGPIERLLDLASVQLHTAAAASDARIPMLDRAEAARLRDRLVALGELHASGV